METSNGNEQWERAIKNHCSICAANMLEPDGKCNGGEEPRSIGFCYSPVDIHASAHAGVRGSVRE